MCSKRGRADPKLQFVADKPDFPAGTVQAVAAADVVRVFDQRPAADVVEGCSFGDEAGSVAEGCV